MPDVPSSHPPSEPRPEKRPARDFGVGYDRPARLQMLVALVLGMVLVAIPLYLWRRPRVESPLVASDAEAPAVMAPSASADGGAAEVDGGVATVAVGEAKVLECHDPGPGRTSPDQCDRLVDFEKLFAKAIQDAASCASPTSGGGLVPYVADVSFQRKRSPVHLTAPKDGRTLKSGKVVAACTAAVKKNLASVTLEGMKHEHARYKVAVTASYPTR